MYYEPTGAMASKGWRTLEKLSATYSTGLLYLRSRIRKHVVYDGSFCHNKYNEVGPVRLPLTEPSGSPPL